MAGREGRTPISSDEVKLIQDRNQKILFTLTLPLLVTVIGGGLLGLASTPTIDRRIILLGTAAVIMNIVAACAGLAAVNWASMAARTRTLYQIQLLALVLALVALFVCLLGVTGTLALAGLRQPDQPAAQNSKADVVRHQVVPDAKEIEPINATASGQAPDHQDNSGNTFSYEPGKAIDGVQDTAWRVSGDGKSQWIQVNYSGPVKVSAVGIIPGHDKIDSVGGTDRFYQLYVVRRAAIEFSDGTVVEADFERDRSMQFVNVDSPKTTTSVRIEILDTYPPGNNPNGQEYSELVYETAISEIDIE
ncbi:MAG TPA: discoidin domain-containing protein [Rubrobacter sp.]|nr:discoidin domain-containing protein [Rubrobacter sp.]